MKIGFILPGREFSNKFLDSWTNIIYSMVFPYKEVRDYLRSLMPEAKFFCLSYDNPRGRENFHVLDFEVGSDEDLCYINTDNFSIEQTIELIKNELG